MPGNDGVAPKIARVVVAFAQRMLDDRPLAKAGRGGDELR